LKKIYPSAKIIVTVRDLRAVFASIEKQHRKNPLVDISGDGISKGIYQTADAMFAPTGMIGHCIEGIMDLIRRKPEGVVYVAYEAFSQNPGAIMGRIYDAIGEAPYKHDFDNVVNTAIDCDGHYLNKYPHKGEGKIEPCNTNEWKDYISPDLAQTIMQRFAAFNQFFGYV
jgi:sulfotransferase